MSRDENDLVMKNMEIPEVQVTKHGQAFRATLMNTRRSAWLGLGLVVLPILFLSGALLRNNLMTDSNIITWFYDWVVDDAPDSDTSVLSWLIRFVLVGGPVLGMLFSLMGILHVHFDEKIREIVIGIKLRWINIIVLLICGFVFTVFFWVLLVENINHT